MLGCIINVSQLQHKVDACENGEGTWDRQGSKRLALSAVYRFVTETSSLFARMHAHAHTGFLFRTASPDIYLSGVTK